MATRTDNDVTLPHDTADEVSRILSDYASSNWDHARRTKSAAVKDQCERNATTAGEIANTIVKGLWTWA